MHKDNITPGSMGILKKLGDRTLFEAEVLFGTKNIKSGIPYEVIQDAMNRMVRKGRIGQLENLCTAYPNIRPDDEIVREAYDDLFFNREMDKARKLYGLIGLEPREYYKHQKETGSFELTAEVLDKTVEKLIYLKKRYVAFLRLSEDGTEFRRGFEKGFYEELEVGGKVSLALPLMQEFNMFGRPISSRYVELNNLLFEDNQKYFV